MLATIGVTILGILIFLFIFWKRLRDDYASEIIFKSAGYIILGFFVGYFFAIRFFPVWFFWTSFIGGIIGFQFAILQFKVKFFETLEAYIMASLPWLGLIFLIDSVTASSLSSFIGFIGILIMVFLSYYLDTQYKRFNWYKSGRVGFAGLAVAIIFFIIRFLIAIFKVPMLSFAGRVEVIVSGLMAIVGIVLLFNLGKIKK